MWQVTSSTDHQNIGEILLGAESGQVLTFRSGTVVPVLETYLNKEETQIIVFSKDYQLTLTKVEEE